MTAMLAAVTVLQKSCKCIHGSRSGVLAAKHYYGLDPNFTALLQPLSESPILKLLQTSANSIHIHVQQTCQNMQQNDPGSPVQSTKQTSVSLSWLCLQHYLAHFAKEPAWPELVARSMPHLFLTVKQRCMQLAHLMFMALNESHSRRGQAMLELGGVCEGAPFLLEDLR